METDLKLLFKLVLRVLDVVNDILLSIVISNQLNFKVGSRLHDCDDCAMPPRG